MVNRILSKIREHALTRGEQSACRFLDRQFSWSELEDRTNQIASILCRQWKIRRQTPIIIYHTRGIEFLEYMVAVLKCGCFYIPLEHTTPVERVKTIYDDVCAGLILTDRSECFEGGGYHSFAYTGAVGAEPHAAERYADFAIEETDLVYCIYTSGTSGNPKGVKIQYRNLLNLVESFYEILYAQLGDAVRVGVLASFSFDSSVKQIYCSLFYGHTLCIAEAEARLFGQKLHDFFARYDVTVCDLTPSHLNVVAAQRVKRVSKIPYLLIGGEVLRWEQLHTYVQRTAHCPDFINLYGPTECCVDVAYKAIDQEELRAYECGIVPIGKSLRNTRLSLRSEDLRSIEEVYTEGELYVTGRQVGAGYVHAESDAFFQEDGQTVYKTGDAAYYDDKGDLVVIGRKDHQVKINGYRVELGEIQSTVEQFVQHPCVVLCVEGAGGNKIAVFIGTAQFSDAEKSKLVEHLRHVLPAYMVPHYYGYADDFPVTENGKIDAKQLQEMLMR
jgi:amino acid adenylation domain-containing protein